MDLSVGCAQRTLGSYTLLDLCGDGICAVPLVRHLQAPWHPQDGVTARRLGCDDGRHPVGHLWPGGHDGVPSVLLISGDIIVN